MTQKSGLAAQIAYVAESTVGVANTTSMVFLPLMKDELDYSWEPLESEGIIAGREVLTSDQWAPGPIKAGGAVGFELYNKNMRGLWKACMGTESGSGPYTYTPGDLTGASLTIQEGVPDGAGTVQPFTFVGCKVNEWELAWEEGKIATLGLDIVAMNCWDYRQTSADGNTTNSSASITSATAIFGPDDVGKPISGTNIPANTTILSVQSSTAATMSANATGTASNTVFSIGVALASASYSSGLTTLHYDQVTVTLGGSAFKVKSGSIKGSNNIVDRRFSGQRTTDEPRGNAKKEYTGTLSTEFFDTDAYKRFARGLEGALVITASNGTNSVALTANIRYDANKPKVNGEDIVPQDIPFKCVGSSTDASALTVVVSTA